MFKLKNKSQPTILAVLIVLNTIFSVNIYAQHESKMAPQQTDSTINTQGVTYLMKNPSTWIQTNINRLNTSAVLHQPNLDTVEINEKLRKISGSNEMIRQNLRYNSITLRIRQVNDLKNEIQSEITDLERLQKKVAQYNNYLLQETTNTILIEREIDYFSKHADSTILKIYRSEIELIDSTIQKSTNFFTSRLLSIVRLEDSINLTALRLQETNKYAQNLINEIGIQQKNFSFPPVWKATPADYPRSFILTVKDTLNQAYDSIIFFLKHNITRLILYRILIFILCLIPVHYYRKNAKKDINIINSQKYLQKYPTLTNLIMGLSVAPLIFTHAPYAFLDLIFISMTICVSIIYIKENNYIAKGPFFILLGSFIILKLINFFTSPTFAGRLLFSLAIFLLIPMYTIYRNMVINKSDQPKIFRIIYLILALQLVYGWILIMLGYYPFGRQLYLTAIDAFILALVLTVIVYTFIDYLRILTFMINKNSHSVYINHEIVEKNLKRIVVVLAMIFFGVAYLKNIDVYDDLSNTFFRSINQPRQLGDSVFTFSSILLFFIITTGSIYLANLINTALGTNDNKKQFKKRTSFGSIMLLLRFSIISIGFLVGIIASGIPVNQLTVLMGALGVGIGFGLQNIFNNLVSGLIIAIEKPVSIGDMVELGNDTGWIKEIGIRSSNLHTFDGAEVIVPNGELISNKVTNWTLSNKSRRMQIKIGVSYKSDPHIVNDLLLQILLEHNEIMKSPEPFIFFAGLGESSLDFELFFWIADFVEGKRIRSEVLFKIFDVLKENNIEIPFPQRDLHIRSVNGEFTTQSNNPDQIQ
jgi:small-conductance mechanosensitive channel